MLGVLFFLITTVAMAAETKVKLPGGHNDLAAGAKLGVRRAESEEGAARLRAWPFDPARRRMSVARAAQAGRTRIDVKGAPEAVLECCDIAFGDPHIRRQTSRIVRGLVGEQLAQVRRPARIPHASPEQPFARPLTVQSRSRA